jgi:tetratricopeptide (TPR) repeat protein
MLKLDEDYDKEAFVEELGTMIEKFPEQAAFYSERGMLKVLMNRSKEAISDFTKAIHLDKDDEDNYRNRGLCFHNLQKYQLALNDYSKAIDLLVKKLQPTQYSSTTKKALSESYNLRGMANKLNGDSDLACDDYYNAAKLGSKAGLNNYRKNCNVFN